MIDSLARPLGHGDYRPESSTERGRHARMKFLAARQRHTFMIDRRKSTQQVRAEFAQAANAGRIDDDRFPAASPTGDT